MFLIIVLLYIVVLAYIGVYFNKRNKNNLPSSFRQLRGRGTCFRSNENQITIITKNGKTEYEKKDKNAVACDIIDQLYKQLLEKKQQNE